MYAIIATGGKQYKVAEGDVIRVEKLGVEAGETVTWRVMIIGGAICTQLLQQVVNSTK